MYVSTYICRDQNTQIMKKHVFSFILFVAVSFTATAQQTTWNGDNSHSSVLFAIEHLTISKTLGWFTDYTVKMTTNKEDFSDASVEIIIQTKSINTANEQRDGHLKSADILDVEKFPTIMFKSTSFKKIKDNLYEVKGNLTMHGVTKEVTLEAVYGGVKTDPYGNTKSGWSIRTKLNRNDYGVTYNSKLEGGGTALGETMDIMCEIELAKQK